MKYMIFIVLMLTGTLSFASEDHHRKEKHHGEGHHEEESHGHGPSKAIGKGKAIKEVNERNGFKLSKEAFEALRLKTQRVSATNITAPKSALVLVNDKVGFYRLRDGFFKFIPVENPKADSEILTFYSSSFEIGDELVTEGLGLLRVTDVYSTDESEYGHAH